MISIIIRTKNEERWIVPCLRAIKQQTRSDYEIVLVDNESTDKTIEKAKREFPNLILVSISQFKPGHAINQGIRSARGEFLVCLSAHCVPTNKYWLQALYENLNDETVAGVYGRQVPVSFSSPADKRDLILTFGLDKRVQEKDSFFHNANSMIRRAVWERYSFDEQVTNMEDRVWGKQVTEVGLKIIYEPEACVYHHHGIHQDNKQDRLRGVVRILEQLGTSTETLNSNPLNVEKMEIAAFIPVKENGQLNQSSIASLLTRTIKQALASKYINNVFVVPDTDHLAATARSSGATIPFIRPESLSSPETRVDDVLQYALTEVEKGGYYPDMVVSLEITHPFRTTDIIDNVIQQVALQGVDTVMTGIKEHRPCWVKRDDELQSILEYTQQRDQRDPIRIGLIGVACATYPEFIRQGSRIGKRLGLYEVADPIVGIEVRNEQAYEAISVLPAPL